MSSKSSPRPILKSSVAYNPSSSSASKSPTSVQFSPSLSTTYLTHGSADYNRSCIVVGPNDCRIPPRGCPGRTYALENQDHGMQWSMDDDAFGTPPLIVDEGSSSDDSDSNPQPSTPPFESYIPASVIARSRTTKSKRTTISTSSNYSTYSSGYPIPRPTAVPRNGDLAITGRDEPWNCLGGF